MSFKKKTRVIQNVAIWLTLPVLFISQLRAQEFYNVLKFGAVNDSSQLITDAVKKAIDAASKKGGGTIYFPAGKYLTGSIHLRSNITIYLDAGAELHFSDNFDNYLPMVKCRYEGVEVTTFSPLFYAWNVENIAIKGRGIIDGHGERWWRFAETVHNRKSRTKWQLMFDEKNKDILLPDDLTDIKSGFLRPSFIQPLHCRNVQIEGITIRNSPFWTINPEFCDNVTITGVTIMNPESPNTDGINPESCRNVHISNCHISVGDDCITIKSGRDAPGRKVNVPAENYTITNCTMLSGHGGVVIGSEMSGGVRKIVISNCVFDGTDRGIRIKSTRGRGGIVEDIRVDNIVMKNIGLQALVLDMQYTRTAPEPRSERTPLFRNIHFSNISGSRVNQACFINGLPETPVENISFSDINIDAESGMEIREAYRIKLHQIEINTRTGPSLKVQNVSRLEVGALGTFTPHPGIPVIDLKDTRDVFIYNASPFTETDNYLRVSGENTRGITLGGNNFVNTRAPFIQTKEVTDAVRVMK